MSIPRPVLIGLVVIAVLAVVFLGVGLTRGDASVDPDDHGWLEVFRFGGGPRVGPDDIDSPCFDRLRERFVVAGTCPARIGESGDRLRVIELEVVQGPRVDVSLDAEDDDAISFDDHEVDLGETISASVGANGGELRLDCRLPPTDECVVRLVP